MSCNLCYQMTKNIILPLDQDWHLAMYHSPHIIMKFKWHFKWTFLWRVLVLFDPTIIMPQYGLEVWWNVKPLIANIMCMNVKSTTPIVELIILINLILSALANDFLSCDFIIHLGHISFKILTKVNRFYLAYLPSYDSDHIL